MMKTDHLRVSAPVAAAVAAGQPVVALESTIITHGMPYPENIEMAHSVEGIIRQNGAVPATIAMMDGMMVAGVGGDDLERLAREGHSAAKASRRDMAALLTKGTMAGTTVATTMLIAQMAGIKVFATGGIGGVHRGAEHTFDVSADISELSQTPVAVVCAGAKSILDIPKTLEMLETNGVPVIGYGTDAFPAFYVRDSGYPADHRFDTPEDVAHMLALHWQLGMGGVLIGNPIPAEFALDAEMIELRVKQAITQAEEQGITRKDITPFLLGRMLELTEGKSLAANIALVKHNAAVAAQIAVALAKRG